MEFYHWKILPLKWNIARCVRTSIKKQVIKAHILTTPAERANRRVFPNPLRGLQHTKGPKKGSGGSAQLLRLNKPSLPYSTYCYCFFFTSCFFLSHGLPLLFPSPLVLTNVDDIDFPYSRSAAQPRLLIRGRERGFTFPENLTVSGLQCRDAWQPNPVFIFFTERRSTDKVVCKLTHSCFVVTFTPDVKAFKDDSDKHRKLNPFTITTQINARRSMKDLRCQAAKSVLWFPLTGLMAAAGAWTQMSVHKRTHSHRRMADKTAFVPKFGQCNTCSAAYTEQ